MKRFKIGDKVIALNSTPGRIHQPRIKGKIYLVNYIIYCAGCGDQLINVSGKIPEGFNHITRCTCNFGSNNNGLWFSSSKHFANIQDLESEIAEAVAEEDYEFADILHKIQEEQLIEK